MNWLLLVLLSIIFWGVGNFLPKVASRYMGVREILFYIFIGSMIVSAFYIIWYLKFNPKISWNPKPIFMALLGGVLGSMGILFFLGALTQKDASVVAPLAALSPLVTVLLSWLLLKEPMFATRIIGIIFSLLALWLLSR